MCLLIGLISLATAIAFLMKGLIMQSIMGFIVASILISIFIYRMLGYYRNKK